MEKIKKFFKSKKLKIALISIGIFIFGIITALSAYFLYFGNKIYPNIYIGQLSFGGLTREKAKDNLENKLKEIRDKDISLNYQEKEWKETSKNLAIEYHIDKTVENLYLAGRNSDFFGNIFARIKLLFKKNNQISVFSYNRVKSNDLIALVMLELNNPSEDARFEMDNGGLEILEEKIGEVVNDEELNQAIIEKIGYMEDRKVDVLVSADNPKIIKAQLEPLSPQLDQVINEKIVLKSEKNNFEVGNQEIFSFLDIVAEPLSGKDTGMIGKVFAKDDEFAPKIIINEEQIKVFADGIASVTNQEPIDAKLTVVDGKATVFAASRDGYELNKEETAKLISKNLEERLKVAGISSNESSGDVAKEIELPLSVKKPLVSDETIDKMGIKELIGSATTNFKKSPPNRVSNIKVGSAIFNGALIEPGETFSTLKTLGDISAEKGFLPELVIKEDGTKPEIGGGLCQVSTTLFRAALNSGLPIVERTNHKYRVSYYEPPVGMDATIYDPAPDLKFENNTPGYILIQSSVSGTEIIFEFYGTKDERVAEISEPVIYDRTEPGEPIYKEDLSLAPGETKQAEKAHQGAKASFHYKVIKDGNILTEKTFYSIYVAWRAVHLKGPREAAPSPSEPPSSVPSPESPSPSPTS